MGATEPIADAEEEPKDERAFAQDVDDFGHAQTLNPTTHHVKSETETLGHATHIFSSDR